MKIKLRKDTKNPNTVVVWILHRSFPFIYLIKQYSKEDSSRLFLKRLQVNNVSHFINIRDAYDSPPVYVSEDYFIVDIYVSWRVGGIVLEKEYSGDEIYKILKSTADSNEGITDQAPRQPPAISTLESILDENIRDDFYPISDHLLYVVNRYGSFR